MSDAARHLVTVRAVLRREWWLVLLVVAVATGGAFLITDRAQPEEVVYEARAAIFVDEAALSASPALPSADRVLNTATGSQFLSQSAEEATMTVEALESGLDVYSTDPAQTRIIVSFRSPVQAEATSTAAVVAENLVASTEEAAKDEFTRQRRIVALTEQAVERMQSLSRDAIGDEAAEVSAAHALWEMRISLERDRALLTALENAYVYDGDVTVREIRKASRLSNNVIGGFVLGIMIGVLVAGVREALLHRAELAEKATGASGVSMDAGERASDR
ncbi:MAG: hypothetical protein QMC79_05780 [Anaerosomatales bacterium]|nr:hypothetical protein [Anaerosomatales bacterium]